MWNPSPTTFNISEKKKSKTLFSKNGNIQKDGEGQVEQRRNNGQTAVWQILWDVVVGWCCFHCWHQHKFSWCGSPCPAWAIHWDTGEEILRGTRERNQRAVAPRPLTHWTLQWPHHSLLFSCTFTHIAACTGACCTTTCGNRVCAHTMVNFEVIWAPLELYGSRRSQNLSLPSPLGGDWSVSELWDIKWYTLKVRWAPVRGTSLKQTLKQTHARQHASMHACVQTCAARINNGGNHCHSLHISGARKEGHALCHLCRGSALCTQSVVCSRNCTKNMMLSATVSRLSTSTPLKGAQPQWRP